MVLSKSDLVKTNNEVNMVTKPFQVEAWGAAQFLECLFSMSQCPRFHSSATKWWCMPILLPVWS